MGVIDRFTIWASGAPVNGQVTKPKVKEFVQDGSPEGHVKKYVDPKMLVAGQNYVLVNTTIADIHGEPLNYQRWGKVVGIDLDSNKIAIDAESRDGLTGKLAVTEEIHSIRSVSKAILEPESGRRYELGQRENARGPFARRQVG